VPWPSICEFPIGTLSVYKDLPSYRAGPICILALVLMVCLVMLSAIRENISESNAEFDFRRFAKIFKKF
jgi:hypothetical protein